MIPLSGVGCLCTAVRGFTVCQTMCMLPLFFGEYVLGSKATLGVPFFLHMILKTVSGLLGTQAGLSREFFTNLPAGRYCNVVSGFPTDSGCSGQVVDVDGSGNANIQLKDSANTLLAIHVGKSSLKCMTLPF